MTSPPPQATGIESSADGDAAIWPAALRKHPILAISALCHWSEMHVWLLRPGISAKP